METRLYAEILYWSFLELINYFSFDLCVCVQNLQVCLKCF